MSTRIRFAFVGNLCRRDDPGGVMDPNRFIHCRWRMSKQTVGFAPPPVFPPQGTVAFRHVPHLSMTMEEGAGRPVALVKMPPPDARIGAFLIGVVPAAPAAQPERWPRDVKTRDPTLEARQAEDPGTVREGLRGEWREDGQHRDFGLRVPADRDPFCRQ